PSTESEIVDLFSGKANGVKWAGCTVDVSTYHVSGSSASISVKVTLVLVATGQSASVPAELSLVKSGDTWKIDDLK
ncbi:MAG: hypothetical protein ACXWQR_00725, partial [Ktedonobacterales bacterium]